MRAVRITLGEDLVARVDQVARRLGTSRSAFTREALRDALESLPTGELEGQHRQGYLANPVAPGEFDAWHVGQVWS